jgi:hypothetical protein
VIEAEGEDHETGGSSDAPFVDLLDQMKMASETPAGQKAFFAQMIDDLEAERSSAEASIGSDGDEV